MVKLEPMLKIIWTTWSREKSGEQGVAGFPEILAKLVHDSFKEICFYDILIKLARAARKIFEYMIDLSSFYKEILNNGRAQRGEIFQVYL